jgi:hypothetical protein
LQPVIAHLLLRLNTWLLLKHVKSLFGWKICMLSFMEMMLALTCFVAVTIYLTKDHMFHERSNHIDIKFHYVRDIVAQGKLKVCKISTHDNPADRMKKPLFLSLSFARA